MQTQTNPDISAIGMTYGYMRTYEDRVRRAGTMLMSCSS